MDCLIGFRDALQNVFGYQWQTVAFIVSMSPATKLAP